MKRHLIIPLAIATFVTMLALVSAQAQNGGDFAVTIPFEFRAAGKTFPAGDYYVRRNFDGAHVVIRLESKNAAASIFVATHEVRQLAVQNESKLVFDNYGKQFFLSKLWYAGRSTGEELNKTGRERAVLQELGRTGKAKAVTIAAKAN